MKVRDVVSKIALTQQRDDVSREELSSLLTEALTLLHTLDPSPREGQLRTSARGDAVRVLSYGTAAVGLDEAERVPMFKVCRVVGAEVDTHQALLEGEVEALYPYVVRRGDGLTWA